MYRPCHLTSLPKLGGPRASPETRREGKVTSKHKQTSDKTQYFPVDGEPLKKSPVGKLENPVSRCHMLGGGRRVSKFLINVDNDLLIPSAQD